MCLRHLSWLTGSCDGKSHVLWHACHDLWHRSKEMSSLWILFCWSTAGLWLWPCVLLMAWMIAYRCLAPLLPVHCIDWLRGLVVPSSGMFRNFIASWEGGCEGMWKSPNTRLDLLFLVGLDGWGQGGWVRVNGKGIAEKRMWCKGCPPMLPWPVKCPLQRFGESRRTPLSDWMEQSNQ